MIHPNEITIGSLLRTNKGEIIRVESISTKRQHRKVGYHTPDDPCRIKYVRLDQCEGIELTPEIMKKSGFTPNEKCPFCYDIGDELLIDLYDKDVFPDKKDYDELSGIELKSGYIYPIPFLVIRTRFVHKLQTYLYALGYEELAMNLKVE